MKKLYVFLAVALMSVISMGTFNSCKKDGVYNPKKKISRTFEQSYGEELRQFFTWDKNKLSKINYGDGSFSVFEYNKNQVSKIIESNGDYITFTYDGSKINKMEHFHKGKLKLVNRFEHSGNKITKMTAEGYDDDDDYMKSKKNDILNFILPVRIDENTKVANHKSHKKNKKATMTSATRKYTWKGNNVVQLDFEQILNDGEVHTATLKFTYDKMNNPFYGLLYNFEMSKNNITKTTHIDNYGNYYEFEYSYFYDNIIPFPIECRSTLRYDNSTYASTTTYYEYE